MKIPTTIVKDDIFSSLFIIQFSQRYLRICGICSHFKLNYESLIITRT